MRRTEAEAEFMSGFDAAAKQDADEFKRLDARIAELEAALIWYGEQAAGCRKIGSDGDAARQALDRDGGARARAALANPER